VALLKASDPIGISIESRTSWALCGEEHAPVSPAHTGIQEGGMVKTDRLVMDAYFCGYDEAFLLTGYSFEQRSGQFF